MYQLNVIFHSALGVLILLEWCANCWIIIADWIWSIVLERIYSVEMRKFLFNPTVYLLFQSFRIHKLTKMLSKQLSSYFDLRCGLWTVVWTLQNICVQMKNGICFFCRSFCVPTETNFWAWVWVLANGFLCLVHQFSLNEIDVNESNRQSIEITMTFAKNTMYDRKIFAIFSNAIP